MLKRIIPLLLVENKEVIKTRSFTDPNYIGDLLNSVKIYNELEVDELCILDRSAKKNGINYDMIREFVNECFSPVSYGGGIKNIGQIGKVLRMGIEKVILASEITDRSLLAEAIKTYGSSSISACINYTKQSTNRIVYFDNDNRNIKINAIDLIQKISKLGVGEIIIQSVDRDGSYLGYDIEFLNEVLNVVKNPIVIAGGCSSIQNIKLALDTGASGAACGSLFVYYTNTKGILINYPSYSEFLEAGIKR